LRRLQDLACPVRAWFPQVRRLQETRLPHRLSRQRRPGHQGRELAGRGTFRPRGLPGERRRQAAWLGDTALHPVPGRQDPADRDRQRRLEGQDVARDPGSDRDQGLAAFTSGQACFILAPWQRFTGAMLHVQ
jgi:hypothetical protein